MILTRKFTLTPDDVSSIVVSMSEIAGGSKTCTGEVTAGIVDVVGVAPAVIVAGVVLGLALEQAPVNANAVIKTKGSNHFIRFIPCLL